MTKELKSKLEAKLQEAGLDKGLLNILSVKSEDEIQGVIDNLSALSTPKPMTTEEILKKQEIQSEIDRRISEAKKKWEGANPPTPADPPKPPATETIEEKLAKMLEEKLNPLSEKLGEFEKNKARDAKLSQARQLLKSSKIPESLIESRLKYLNTDSEETLEDWVKNQEVEHEAYAQALVDQGTVSGLPPKPVDTVEPSAEQLDAIIDSTGIV